MTRLGSIVSGSLAALSILGFAAALPGAASARPVVTFKAVAVPIPINLTRAHGPSYPRTGAILGAPAAGEAVWTISGSEYSRVPVAAHLDQGLHAYRRETALAGICHLHRNRAQGTRPRRVFEEVSGRPAGRRDRGCELRRRTRSRESDRAAVLQARRRGALLRVRQHARFPRSLREGDSSRHKPALRLPVHRRSATRRNRARARRVDRTAQNHVRRRLQGR